MKGIIAFLAVILLLSTLAPAKAGSTDPLYISMTSDDAHRASMAIGFGQNQLQRNHPLTIFLNDKGVRVASTVNAAAYTEHQKMLADILAKGGIIYVCPTCMKHYGVKESELVAGLKVSNPDLNSAALFKDNTRTLSW